MDFYWWHPYSADQRVLLDHIHQMKAIGVDFAPFNWRAPSGLFQTWLTLCEEENFLTCAHFGPVNGFPEVPILASAYLQELEDVYTYTGSAAYLKVNGYPLYIGYSTNALPGAQMDKVLQALADRGKRFTLLGDGYTYDNLLRFEGVNMYNPMFDATQYHGQDIPNRRARVLVRNFHKNHPTAADKILALTVMGRYNDTDIPERAPGFVYGDQIGVTYQFSWNAAIANRPDIILGCTGNEGPESTGMLLDQVEGRTITFSASLVTDNVFTATIVTGGDGAALPDVVITVPFRDDHATTMADIAVAIEQQPHVVSAVLSGQHQINVRAVPYVLPGLPYLIILDPLVTGGGAQARVTQSNVFLDLTAQNIADWKAQI
jgi:hypothetical protein